MNANARADLLQHAQRLSDNLAAVDRPCKVCGESAQPYVVLDFALTCNTPRMPAGPSGIPVQYYRCRACAFVFTPFCDDFTPAQWTTHIYNEAYYQEVDPDYAERRPLGNALAIDALLSGRHSDWIGLDYGGGNGRTAELLRSMGYHYECHDPFGVSDDSDSYRGRYNFCSVFEVAEHAPDPAAFLREITALCTPGRLAVLVGTHVNDRHTRAGGSLDWWYAAPRNGHISLHSRRSLALLARAQDLDCVSLTEQTHLFSRGYTRREALTFLWAGKIKTRWRRVLGRHLGATTSPTP